MAGLGRRTFAAGEVLTASNVMGYLQDQAVMAFAGTAARGSAIGSAVSEGMVSYLADTNAVEVYDGVGWNQISQAQSPNVLINAGFDICQRGGAGIASFTNPSAGSYNIDRWRSVLTGTGGTRVISSVAATPGEIAGIDAKYFLKFDQQAAATGGANRIITLVEDAATLAGKVVTFSIYMKGSSAQTLTGGFAEQYFGTGGSPSSVVTNGFNFSDSSLTTNWKRFTATFTVPSVVGKTFGTNNDSSLSINIYLPTAGVYSVLMSSAQLEAGSTATPFRRNANSIQGELAACQRYYYRSVGDSGVYTGHATGLISGYAGGIYSYYLIPLPVTMRVAPTSIDSSAYGTFAVSDGVNVSTNTALPALSTNNSSRNNAFITATHGGLTSYRPAWFQANNTTSSYIGFNAEL